MDYILGNTSSMRPLDFEYTTTCKTVVYFIPSVVHKICQSSIRLVKLTNLSLQDSGKLVQYLSKDNVTCP